MILPAPRSKYRFALFESRRKEAEKKRYVCVVSVQELRRRPRNSDGGRVRLLAFVEQTLGESKEKIAAWWPVSEKPTYQDLALTATGKLQREPR
jgi:hypothetical protein